jgi:hypothetical protein
MWWIWFWMKGIVISERLIVFYGREKAFSSSETNKAELLLNGAVFRVWHSISIKWTSRQNLFLPNITLPWRPRQRFSKCFYSLLWVKRVKCQGEVQGTYHSWNRSKMSLK